MSTLLQHFYDAWSEGASSLSSNILSFISFIILVFFYFPTLFQQNGRCMFLYYWNIINCLAFYHGITTQQSAVEATSLFNGSQLQQITFWKELETSTPHRDKVHIKPFLSLLPCHQGGDRVKDWTTDWIERSFFMVTSSIVGNLVQQVRNENEWPDKKNTHTQRFTCNEFYGTLLTHREVGQQWATPRTSKRNLSDLPIGQAVTNSWGWKRSWESIKRPVRFLFFFNSLGRLLAFIFISRCVTCLRPIPMGEISLPMPTAGGSGSWVLWSEEMDGKRGVVVNLRE